MRAFNLLLEKRPEALIGYTIAQIRGERIAWMAIARRSLFKENKDSAVRRARQRNRELLGVMRSLYAKT